MMKNANHRMLAARATAAAMALSLGMGAVGSALAQPMPHRGDGRHDPRWNHNAESRRPDHQPPQYHRPAPPPPAYHRPGPPPHVVHPGYRPAPPAYPRGAGPDFRWHRGDRIPPAYRGRNYVVNDWRVHRLAPPPRGYHWVQYGADYLLVAIATGVITSMILAN